MIRGNKTLAKILPIPLAGILFLKSCSSPVVTQSFNNNDKTPYIIK